MRKQFRRRPLSAKSNKRWVFKAVGMLALLWMGWWLWLTLERRVHSTNSYLPVSESTTLVSQHREAFLSDIGAIATVAGGAFFLLKVCTASKKRETANLSGFDFNGAHLSGTDLSGANLSGADLGGADLSKANLSGANLSGANLAGADLSKANLRYADLRYVNLSGASLERAELQYANLSQANLRYANLIEANLRHADLSGTDLNCALLRYANLSEANLSEALLFFINLREVLNLEPYQLEGKSSPFLCNVALPAYSKRPEIEPNSSCAYIPRILSDRYDISLEEAEEIVNEALQHPWD